MSEQDPRLSYPQGGDASSTSAYAEREARLAADIAAMQAGPTEHAAGLTDHHQGMPKVETQMKTHGAAPPRVPDTGGHG